MVDDWLTDRVISGLSWKAIHKLMYSPDIFPMGQGGFRLEAKYIKYDHVRNLIRTRMGVLAKRNPNPFISINLWHQNLQMQGWNTYLHASHDSPEFVFAFQSPWQKQQLLNHGWGMLMLDSTHNSVDNRSLSKGRKFSLYTFVIRDPIVGKGLPVCWAFTASAAAEPVQAIIKWLRESTGIVPCAIMSDCALAIKKGVTDAYSDLGQHAPKVYWCLFHVLKAFKNRAMFFLRKRSEEAMKEFRQIVYGNNPENQLHLFYAKWSSVSTTFVDYVETQWHTNIVHWAVFYRNTPHQGIHTNNYTEAWHRILKEQFVDTQERRRIDEVVQVLTDEVHTSYLMTQSQVSEGIIAQRVNQFQSHAKAKADGYTPEIMELLGITIYKFQVHYCVSSFTNPTTKFYLVRYVEPKGSELGWTTACSCEYFMLYGSGCKHMYYLSNEYNLLVVENPMEYTIKPTTYPGLAMDPSNVTEWTTDRSSMRQEILVPTVDVPLHLNRSGGPFKKQRTTSSDNTFPTVVVTSETQDDTNEPLLTMDELSQIISNRLHTVESMRSPGYTSNRQLLNMSNEEVTRHLTNLSASLVTAVKGLNNIHKHVKTRRLVASRCSPELMWWFMERAVEISSRVLEKCPKASKAQVAYFPGVAVVQCLPRDQVEQLMERLQQAGCKALALAYKHLTHKDHKLDFIMNSTVEEMECLRAECWGFLGTMENMVQGEKDRKQQR
ncbi:hypothetical protein PGT21_013159 [Puccinia graminis f. sp. tritici]|uniref:SWIM-type domain-containing protein n=1 Tax=Puccinia graminis f. sp. tritici TaxID=56615 RepID=A0A5B0QAP1_PUCGR|nr:hypothetical protein PGT21_013159 [Puccinia graminis f. sp. tritici]